MKQEEFKQRYQYDPAADKLGEGGFGSVYKAYDNHRDQWVALKIAKVNPEYESIRLKKEVEMVAKLPSHPNIAYYEDCYTFASFDGEYDFGILQYYEEGNLSQLLKNAVLTPAQKQSVLLQILDGIGFLHRNGVIHRDLKPQNILIVNRNGEYVPKITDFGISKQLDVNRSSAFSNSIAGAGTLAYASPEQLADRTIRKNADLWSFGVIAFQVLTGELPFTTGDHAVTSESGRQELFRQINAGRLPESVNAIPEIWQWVIRRCLVVDTQRRVQHVSALQDILSGKAEDSSPKAGGDNACEGATRVDTPPVSPSPTSPPSPSSPPSSRPADSGNVGAGFKPALKSKPLLWGLAVAGIALLLVLFWIFGKGVDEAALQPMLSSLNGKYGYVDKKGREVIPFKYDQAEYFSEGFAAVKLNGKTGFINKTGKEIIPLKYDWAMAFSEGLACVSLSHKCGFIDKTGKEIIPFKYDYARDFSEGFAVVHLNGKYGYVDKKGKEITPLKYDYAMAFSEGLAAVSLNTANGYKHGYIDQKGREVIPLKYDGAWNFSEGLALVELNGKTGYIDQTGNLIIPFKFDGTEFESEAEAVYSTSNFSGGLASVCINGKCGVIDKTGKEIIPLKYDWAPHFYEGFTAVRLNGKCGYIDQTGKEVIPFKYDDARDFSEGLASVNLNGKYGYIDKKGREIIPFKYDNAWNFSEGHASVTFNGGESFYIDKKGNRVN